GCSSSKPSSVRTRACPGRVMRNTTPPPTSSRKATRSPWFSDLPDIGANLQGQVLRNAPHHHRLHRHRFIVHCACATHGSHPAHGWDPGRTTLDRTGTALSCGSFGGEDQGGGDRGGGRERRWHGAGHAGVAGGMP